MESERLSSPGSLSSPPHSPEQGTPNNSSIRVTTPHTGGVGVASTTTTPRLTAAGQPRKKPGPKPKAKDPSTEEKKATTTSKRQRKTVEPKDPNAAPAPRKRRTKQSLEAQAAVAAPAPAPVDDKPAQQIVQQASRPAELAPVPQPEQSSASAVAQPPRVLANAEPLHGNPNLSHISAAPSTPRPASSGQRYDPIRGGVFESKPSAPASAPPISPPLNRASASPSITSLIDPPTASNSMYPQTARLQQQASITSAPVSPAATATRPASALPHHDTLPPQQPQPRHAAPAGPTPMDIDSDVNSKVSVSMKRSDSNSAGTPSHSNAPTPPVKAARQKEVPPPLTMGSGLLAGTPFGPAAGPSGPAEPHGVNIYLHFPLKDRRNVTINFAQEVEKKYGFAALHPRIAARQERQRQITAAGAALEREGGKGSADDMSLDQSENESNNDVTCMDDEGSATNGAKKQKRKRKVEDYDKDDDFIDDAELAWEQQALMVKDGFFVYSGPLVTEERPTIEKADGSVKRGRGRGRGGAVRGEPAGRGRGRGGGPGSRGGSTVRKPRVTKADRVMMEQEKNEREKLAIAMAGKPAIQQAYSGVSAV
ncbi:HPC2-domain-containing protein [Massarina eburnea CBS 473.64]|uniref:HPC2-domain-containing protein n=1 Tax=Massarina eburnea CBS 473.64 TaxID=1395130 RepID=A0A6A6S304_9PLEO|nr:HPC2-domain-containing protein [Massarina eburnea CBS 473.64]